ncbi:hypothetical protein LSAT2_023876 [Lamellibrachia satsuma]|nr:hypothetical protein LSAT2_023876 [Lamellibrachia satsuma]
MSWTEVDPWGTKRDSEQLIRRIAIGFVGACCECTACTMPVASVILAGAPEPSRDAEVACKSAWRRCDRHARVND